MWTCIQHLQGQCASQACRDSQWSSGFLTGSKPRITDQKLMLFSHGIHHPMNISHLLASYETNETNTSKVVMGSSRNHPCLLKHKIKIIKYRKKRIVSLCGDSRWPGWAMIQREQRNVSSCDWSKVVLLICVLWSVEISPVNPLLLTSSHKNNGHLQH